MVLSTPVSERVRAQTFCGIYPAVVTPFAADGSVDVDGFTALAEWLLEAGVNGLYVGGNTGEWYAQSLDERRRIAEAAVRVARGRGRVIVHVGAVNTEDALWLARCCAEAGVDGISSLPPYIAKWTLPEVVHYYKRLCSATDLPCFVYHFPHLTGSFGAQRLVSALRDQATLAGLKFTDMDLFEMERVLSASAGRVVVFNGHDQVLLAGLTMGASGGIGSFYNVIPERFVRLYCAFSRGALAEARQEQCAINEVIETVRQYRLVPALRFMLRLRGLKTGHSREPTLKLSAEEESKLAEGLERAGSL